MPRHIKQAGSFVALGGAGGNATVPVDAPIQPPQAFVDAIAAFAFYKASGFSNIASLGITHIDPTWFASVVTQGNGLASGLIASGNSLDVISVNGILAASANGPDSPNNLNLSGGTNAAPTGQGLTDKASLINNGWTVTTNS